MKEYNKNAPQSLTGQRGEYQDIGELNHTITKEIRVLRWILQQTIKKQKATAFDSFTHNQDTMFTTRVSMLCSKYNLDIPRKQVTHLTQRRVIFCAVCSYFYQNSIKMSFCTRFKYHLLVKVKKLVNFVKLEPINSILCTCFRPF